MCVLTPGQYTLVGIHFILWAKTKCSILMCRSSLLLQAMGPQRLLPTGSGHTVLGREWGWRRCGPCRGRVCLRDSHRPALWAAWACCGAGRTHLSSRPCCAHVLRPPSLCCSGPRDCPAFQRGHRVAWWPDSGHHEVLMRGRPEVRGDVTTEAGFREI